jgi:hypothetical protein
VFEQNRSRILEENDQKLSKIIEVHKEKERSVSQNRKRLHEQHQVHYFSPLGEIPENERPAADNSKELREAEATQSVKKSKHNRQTFQA